MNLSHLCKNEFNFSVISHALTTSQVPLPLPRCPQESFLTTDTVKKLEIAFVRSDKRLEIIEHKLVRTLAETLRLKRGNFEENYEDETGNLRRKIVEVSALKSE